MRNEQTKKQELTKKVNIEMNEVRKRGEIKLNNTNMIRATQNMHPFNHTK